MRIFLRPNLFCAARWMWRTRTDHDKRLFAFLPVATVLLAAPASAQEKKVQASSASVEEARERFGKGVELYREGSLEAALAEFEKAAQLAPSYRLHYNIAQVQYELHNYVGAMRAYRRYLSQGGEQVTGDRRAKVEAEIAELEGRVAHLAVNTNVPGAVIAVDEVRVGMAPLNGAVLINPGVRRVSALKPGHLPATVTVTAAGGERIDVALDLAAVTSPDSGRVVLPPVGRARPGRRHTGPAAAADQDLAQHPDDGHAGRGGRRVCPPHPEGRG